MTRRLELNAVDTKRLEKESARMESKLETLRGLVAKERESVSEGRSKWRHGGENKPLKRGYVSHVSTSRPPPRRLIKGNPSEEQIPTNAPPPTEGITSPTTTTTTTTTPTPPVVQKPKTKIPPPSSLSAAKTAQMAGSNPPVPNLSNFKPLSKTAEGGKTLRRPSGGHGVNINDMKLANIPSSSSVQSKTNQTVVGSNLSNALSMQARELREVEEFLSEMGLERYFKLFEEQGFDCMETVLCMTEKHLVDLGIPQGHRIKFFNRLNGKSGIDSPVKGDAHSISSKDDSTTGYSPKKGRVSFDSTANKPTRRLIVNEPTGGSLFDGQYDEKEAAASFQEALAAWRGAPTAASNDAPSRKDAASKKSFSWGEVGNEAFVLDPNVEKELSATSLKTGIEQFSMPSLDKNDTTAQRHCCYVCFKQFTGDGIIEMNQGKEKSLCSEPCREAFLREIEEKKKRQKEREEMQKKVLEPIRLREEQLIAASEPSIYSSRIDTSRLENTSNVITTAPKDGGKTITTAPKDGAVKKGAVSGSASSPQEISPLIRRLYATSPKKDSPRKNNSHSSSVKTHDCRAWVEESDEEETRSPPSKREERTSQSPKDSRTSTKDTIAQSPKDTSPLMSRLYATSPKDATEKPKTVNKPVVIESQISPLISRLYGLTPP